MDNEPKIPLTIDNELEGMRQRQADSPSDSSRTSKCSRKVLPSMALTKRDSTTTSMRGRSDG